MRPSMLHQRHIGRCCDHRAMSTDECKSCIVTRSRASAGRMPPLAGWLTKQEQRGGRQRREDGPDWMTDWMEPLRPGRSTRKETVVSSTLDRVIERGARARIWGRPFSLKQEPGKGLFVGGGLAGVDGAGIDR
jgi:hypothetical protein